GTDQERIAHYGLGWMYHKQEIYHWAADEFKIAAQGSDTLARKALYYKAVNEKLGGQYQTSIESFRTFGDKYTEGLWVEPAYYEWAVTAYEMSKYGEAIQTLLSLIRSDQELEWEGKIYTWLGEAYFANKEFSRALQAYEAAEQVGDIPPSVKRQARFQKAWLQYRNQAYQQAQQNFEDIYQEAPESKYGKQALFWGADAYYNMKQFGQASQLFQRFFHQYRDHKLAGEVY